MFMAIRPSKLLPVLLALMLSACGDFDEPETLSPRRFFGCYGDGQNQLTITQDSVRINGAELRYEIQERRVGYVIAIPAIFVSRNGALQAKEAADHFYRLVDEDSARHVIIADQNAYIHELQFGRCGSG